MRRAHRIAVWVFLGLVLPLLLASPSLADREFVGKVQKISKKKMIVDNRMGDKVAFESLKDTEVEGQDKKSWKDLKRNDWVSAPVVDENGRLLGRITIDDVVDVIREDADHSFMSMAGLDEDEDTFAPLSRTAPRRAIWLGINLVTAFIAASVINLFQDTIEKVVALAVLMPIVASMGGIAGTQTLTVLVRGIAMGQVGRNNQAWLINREFLIGLINGLLWAAVVAIAASLWFNDWNIGIIIAAAMIINLVTAGFTGAVLPLMMTRLNIDPALAGGVVLTTVTDVVGFVSFLGLATLFYA